MNRTDVDDTAPNLCSGSMVQTLPIVHDQRLGEFDQFYPRISRYVLTLLHDPADAEDATQEAFLRAHQRHDSLRDPAAALPWLYSIATHVCLTVCVRDPAGRTASRVRSPRPGHARTTRQAPSFACSRAR